LATATNDLNDDFNVEASTRVSSGCAGLDKILEGGYPPGHLYLLEGDPGAGKTTLALQFVAAGARQGERSL
jgi:circadian clock protein KaiC